MAMVIMPQKTALSVVTEAGELLKTARFGLDDLKAKNARSQAGLRNIIVFGRAVTFALQNLRSIVDGFDEWYQPHQDALKANSAASYMFRLRTEIEKQARAVQTGVMLSLDLNPETRKLMFPAPPNAGDFIIGDRNGGSGWLIETPEGQEIYYVSLPPALGRSELVMVDAPGELKNASAVDLSKSYLFALGEVLQSARERFLG